MEITKLQENDVIKYTFNTTITAISVVDHIDNSVVVFKYDIYCNNEGYYSAGASSLESSVMENFKHLGTLDSYKDNYPELLI